MRKAYLLTLLAPFAFGCSATTSFVDSDTTLGRIVVYRNGVAYYERTAEVEGDTLELKVPADKVDDFLKSLTVLDAATKKPAPIAYPTRGSSVSTDGTVTMNVKLTGGDAPKKLLLTYVTESPSWKPSYRVVIGDNGKVTLMGWAIVDNTSGEDWKNVKLGVGSSSALSFRYDLSSIRSVARETLRPEDLFAQVVTLKAVKTGGTLMRSLEKKLEEVSDKLSKATVDLVALEEQRMISRIKLQDGIAELSFEGKDGASKLAGQ